MNKKMILLRVLLLVGLTLSKCVAMGGYGYGYPYNYPRRDWNSGRRGSGPGPRSWR